MATKLPSGKYRTQVLVSNSPRRYKSFTGKTPDEADVKAKTWKMAHGHTRTDTFTKCAERFIRDMDGVLSPNTIRVYRTTLKQILEEVPELTCLELTDITKQNLLRIAHLRKAPKTIRNYLGFISSVFSYNDIQMPKVKAPERPRNAVYIPDDKMVRQIIKLAEGTRLEVPVALAVRGMRPGEICAVRAEDIHGNTLHICRAMAYTGSRFVIKAPKTKRSDRVIQIPLEIANKIKEDGQATKMSTAALTAAFQKFRKANDLPYFRLYDLRHAFVSIAHANQIPDSVIMAMGGWSTPYTMQNVYRHALEPDVVKYSNRLEDILG